MNRGGVIHPKVRKVVEIIQTAPIVGSNQLERRSIDLHRRAKDSGLDALAAAAGCTIRREPLMPHGARAALATNGMIFVPPDDDAHEQRLAALHMVARWDLQSRAHSDGDVWYLALAIAIPRPLLQRMWVLEPLTGRDVSWAIHVPMWAIDARILVLS